MNNPTPIRLLASGNNERGDLFTRLTRDLFFALGYDDLRLNVNKSGREVDLQGQHRFEPRRVIAECKAHADKMGGAELNKFFGVLTRERKGSAPTPVAGYFVSLGGFTETGIDQELQTDDGRIILLDAQNVVDELERCRVIVGRTKAAERAGRCARHAGLQDEEFDYAELVGHRLGYMWAIFYAHSKQRTHFALIHADGTPLAQSIATEVIEMDNLCGGLLHSLQYLPPPTPAPDRNALALAATERYRSWLGEECGYIRLDGLPADTDLSATRLKLERLFVPLKVTFLPNPSDDPGFKRTLSKIVLSIGKALEMVPHLALLAMPGGGKSTLLKRLATAYAFPERRDEVPDDLPQRDWLPLMLRCRELRERAHRPIMELLDDIPVHAGMNTDECAIFRESIHAALCAGQALLLVDGLDEISEEGARQIFANHLRTFVAVFPKAALVVTSREAGFRLVAGVMASACEQAKLAPLDRNDVLSLCERWYVEVLGHSDRIRIEANKLGRTIWENERIRTLTENPLLLTTLLVVKRWVGELPRSRISLYREAIRVLVRTWNVEGYAALDEDETLAQLSYVACAMMQAGKQRIGQKELLKLLQSARRELEAELQFARISPQEFIERIEYRSSLLMQTGHEPIDGVLDPVYEFRHLTFQEYLAARGYVEEQYPGRALEEGLADLLERHFEDERWREVISLAAVLAGRKAEELIKRLTVACDSRNQAKIQVIKTENDSLRFLLYQCIRDEVQVTAPTLGVALTELARNRRGPSWDFEPGWVTAILRGKFRAIFQEIVEQACLKNGYGFVECNMTLSQLAIHLHFGDEKPVMSDSVANSLRNALETGDRLGKICAALVCMRLAFTSGSGESLNTPNVNLREHFRLVLSGLCMMLDSSDLPCALAASWALAWMGEHRLLKTLPEPEMVMSLYRLWRQQESKELAVLPAWGVAAQKLLLRDTFNKDIWGDCDSYLLQAVTRENAWPRIQQGALIVGWYRRSPWSDVELVELLSHKMEAPYFVVLSPTFRELLENLGDEGQRVLEEWDRKQAKKRGSLR